MSKTSTNYYRNRHGNKQRSTCSDVHTSNIGYRFTPSHALPSQRNQATESKPAATMLTWVRPAYYRCLARTDITFFCSAATISNQTPIGYFLRVGNSDVLGDIFVEYDRQSVYRSASLTDIRAARFIGCIVAKVYTGWIASRGSHWAGSGRPNPNYDTSDSS